VFDRRRWQHRLALAVLRGHLMIASAEEPEWRRDPRHRPAAMLMVGAPVRPLR
jgi:hypothetical protein